MSYCPQCGVRFPDEANFCVQCGQGHRAAAEERTSSLGVSATVSPRVEPRATIAAEERDSEPSGPEMTVVPRTYGAVVTSAVLPFMAVLSFVFFIISYMFWSDANLTLRAWGRGWDIDATGMRMIMAATFGGFGGILGALLLGWEGRGRRIDLASDDFAALVDKTSVILAERRWRILTRSSSMATFRPAFGLSITGPIQLVKLPHGARVVGPSGQLDVLAARL